MTSTPETSRNDPHDVLGIAPDVVMVARAAADFPSLAPDAAMPPPGRQPHMDPDFSDAHDDAPYVDASFRASDVHEGVRKHGRWMKTVAVAFLLALGSAFATAGWEYYGAAGRVVFSGLPTMPSLVSWLPSWRDAAPTAGAADQAAATTAQTASGAPTASAPDTTQMLQSVSRDVASLTQQVTELKASIAQLKAAQEQSARDTAGRIAEARAAVPRPADARPKQLGAPPKPLGTLVQHKPKPPVYPQTAAGPPPTAAVAPVQLAPTETDADSAVRPPMPVR